MARKKSISTQVNADLAALREKVGRKREYLELLEGELANTRAIIQEFTEIYGARITPLETRYRRLQAVLEEITEDMSPPENGWRGRSGAKAGNSTNGHAQSREWTKVKVDGKSSLVKDPEYERKVHDLFRRLAKRFHPDLAQLEDEKQQRQKIMAEINRAYTAKDLEALENLEMESQNEGINQWSGPEAEIARLTLELRQLETMIFEVEQTIRELDLSPAMHLRGEMKGDRVARNDYFAELESDFREKISLLQEQLIALGADLTRVEFGEN
ncbi:MAG: hypothetical protein ACRDFQ_04030 [Anaerolineales bacterium]